MKILKFTIIWLLITFVGIFIDIVSFDNNNKLLSFIDGMFIVFFSILPLFFIYFSYLKLGFWGLFRFFVYWFILSCFAIFFIEESLLRELGGALMSIIPLTLLYFISGKFYLSKNNNVIKNKDELIKNSTEICKNSSMFSELIYKEILKNPNDWSIGEESELISRIKGPFSLYVPSLKKTIIIWANASTYIENKKKLEDLVKNRKF